MRLDSLFRVLFVVYCLEAGIFLVVAPWTEGWQRVALMVPIGALRTLIALPWMRGLVSGFGIVHLVWAAHDIDLVFRGAPARASDSSPVRRH